MGKPLRGHSNLDPREKNYFLWIFYEIINKDIDLEFVRLNKHTFEIH